MASRRLLCLLCWLIGQWTVDCAMGQTVQFPSSTGSAFSGGNTIPPLGSPNLSAPTFTAPSFTAPPQNPSFGTPTFGAPAASNPSFSTPSFSAPSFGGTPSTPAAPSSWFGGNNVGQPYTSTPFGTGYGTPPSNPWPSATATGANPYGAATPIYPFGPPPANAYGTPANPYGAPGQPYGGNQALFPNGLWGPNAAGSGPWQETFRLLQHPRLSYTLITGGNDPDSLQIQDIETAISLVIPHFLISTQPLYVTPTFALHLWDGPTFMAADLPANAYSAYVDTFWESDPCRPFGAEIGVAVGAFTDFDTFNKHSIRVIGEGFGVVRLTPNLTFKLGVWYLNRNDLKLLPAGGLVWQPNPQTKFDILFPNPKFSQYLSTVGTTDVWWYLAAEYGGGAWTIQRADGSSDRVDINDIRVKLGLDWTTQRQWRAFAEVGYVFDRQVVYVVNPGDSFKAKEAFMLSAGFSF